MAKLLWISDAGRPTGFGNVTHSLGERLVAMGHEVHVLAVGWDAKYPVPGPLKLYRADAGPARSYLGYDRVVEVLEVVQPDLVVINEDAPMLYRRLMDNRFDPDQFLLKNFPIVAYLPIDGYGLPKQWLTLPKLVTVVPYTEFAAEQLEMDPKSHIDHGVDPAFRPFSAHEKRKARHKLGIDDDVFVIGRVDTNSGRKDWGSTWKAIDIAYSSGALDENRTVALFHTKLNEPNSGVNLEALISRGRGKYMVTNESGWPVEALVEFINCFDVTISTSRGEGWGLTLAESLACGVPVIATNCSSIPEVVGWGGRLHDPVAAMTNPYGLDLMLADVEGMASSLVGMQRDPSERSRMAQHGLDHVKQFNWDDSATRFNEVIEGRLAQT